MRKLLDPFLAGADVAAQNKYYGSTLCACQGNWKEDLLNLFTFCTLA